MDNRIDSHLEIQIFSLNVSKPFRKDSTKDTNTSFTSFLFFSFLRRAKQRSLHIKHSIKLQRRDTQPQVPEARELDRPQL